MSVGASDTKISGIVFGDYYYIAGNHDKNWENMNGFWLRRVYLTFDHKLGDGFSTRLRLEMATPSGLNSAAGRADPFLKDAFIKYKTGKHEVIMGISGTPTWSVVEEMWGFRPAEKTPLDLHRMGSSRDFGIALKGSLDNAGKFKYHLMAGNGNSNRSENNKGKKAMLSLGYYPNKRFMMEIYGDWNDLPGESDRSTLQFLSVFTGGPFRLGLQYVHQTRQAETDEKLRLVSVFSTYKLSKKSHWFGRVDTMLDLNPGAQSNPYIPFSPIAKSTFIISGIEFKLHKNYSVIPNVEIVLYRDPVAGEEKPANDFIPRLTFSFTY